MDKSTADAWLHVVLGHDNERGWLSRQTSTTRRRTYVDVKKEKAKMRKINALMSCCVMKVRRDAAKTGIALPTNTAPFPTRLLLFYHNSLCRVNNKMPRVNASCFRCLPPVFVFRLLPVALSLLRVPAFAANCGQPKPPDLP